MTVHVILSATQNLLKKSERCLQLLAEFETAREAVRECMTSACHQFDVAEQLSQSHGDLLRKQQIIQVDTALHFVALHGCHRHFWLPVL